MVELTAEQIAQRAFDLDLLDQRQLKEVWGVIGSRQVTGDEFRQLLERRELLTNYQSERLLRGDRTGFFYGDFKVLYLIGTGTFARVYRAAHRHTGEIRAVKVLRRRFADNPIEAERFLREGEMGATLRHPNIVPIYEVVARGDVPFLVMDFVEGRNLREFIKIRKKFDPTDATRMIADVAAGLSYAFEKGICHRDLKMSNILISSRGQAKLVDFGLAAAENQDDDENANPRTIDYAGLERATGVRKDDNRSDIFFLGAIYYHLLTGVAPIVETRDRSQRLSRSRFTSIIPIQQVDASLPKAVITVVTRAMEFNPAQPLSIAGGNGRRVESGRRQIERSRRCRRSGRAEQNRRRWPAVVVDGGRIEVAATKCVSRAVEERGLSGVGHGRPGTRVGSICRESKDCRLCRILLQRFGRIGHQRLQSLGRDGRHAVGAGGVAVGRTASVAEVQSQARQTPRRDLLSRQAARAARRTGPAIGRNRRPSLTEELAEATWVRLEAKEWST